MYVLGIHGGLLKQDEREPMGHLFHDSAAVLILDGKVISAIEEERLDRIKHSNCFPLRATAHCLQRAGITLADVSRVSVNISRYVADAIEKAALLTDPQYTLQPDAEERLSDLFRRSLGADIRGKVWFCNHHLAHAWSAFAPTPFEESLIFTVDGDGDNSSGMMLVGKHNQIIKLREYSVRHSLGRLYHTLILFLGFKRFDEFKAMGLAPYGDPAVYRQLFSSCYQLLPNGDYLLDEHTSWFAKFEQAGLLKYVRRKNAPFTQMHMDFAAALQETVEKVIFHVLKYYRQVTKQRHLCLAGGVVHNCTVNGKILRSGLFDEVYAQPLAHDAGGALGAGWWAYYSDAPNAVRPRLPHLYLGGDVGGCERVRTELAHWDGLVEYERADDIAARTAKLLAAGAVVGWVQGRSEFGPRALGNRSILADPRPSENKLLINEMVKKREQFRPFAPSVLAEYADEYFELPVQQKDFPFMIFVVHVREHVRSLLGAVTHIDGTARIQTVSRSVNPLYWRVIDEFRKLTGVPVLLNTSFNNNAEPIVESIDDAVSCFLTTGLNYLVLGDFIVRKASDAELLRARLGNLAPSLPPHYKLVWRNRAALGEYAQDPVYEIEGLKSRDFDVQTVTILPEVYRVLSNLNGRKSLHELMRDAGISGPEQTRVVLREMEDLWSRRVLQLRPIDASGYRTELPDTAAESATSLEVPAGARVAGRS